MEKKTLVIGVIGADVHAVGNQILYHAFTDAGFNVVNLGVMVSQEESTQLLRQMPMPSSFPPSMGRASLIAADFAKNAMKQALPISFSMSEAISLSASSPSTRWRSGSRQWALTVHSPREPLPRSISTA